MMNQDQYHASLLGKRIESDVGWAGITRATRPKPMAPEPPNMTDPEQSIERLRQDDADLQMLNLNNIKVSGGNNLNNIKLRDGLGGLLLVHVLPCSVVPGLGLAFGYYLHL